MTKLCNVRETASSVDRTHYGSIILYPVASDYHCQPIGRAIYGPSTEKLIQDRGEYLVYPKTL